MSLPSHNHHPKNSPYIADNSSPAMLRTSEQQQQTLATQHLPAILHAPPLVKGMLFSKKALYPAVEIEFRSAGRGIRAAKGGSKQRAYFCDQRVQNKDSKEEQGCTACVRATLQTTGEFKLTHVNTVHVNCAGSSTNTTVRAMAPLLSSVMNIDPKISGATLKTIIEASTGATMSARSVSRARAAMRQQASDCEEANTYEYLRSYLEELKAHSPGTVACVKVSENNIIICPRAVTCSRQTRCMYTYCCMYVVSYQTLYC